MCGRRLWLTVGFLTGASLATSGIETASAATITSSRDFGLFAPIGSPNASQTLTLDLFDSDLGILTGVRFLWHGSPRTEPTSFSGQLGVSAFADFPDDEAIGSAQVSATIRTVVPQGGLDEILSRDADDSDDCRDLSDCEATAAFNDPFSESFDVPDGGRAAFGTPGGGTFTAEQSLRARFNGSTDPNGTVDGGSAEWFGTLTVEYNYDPTTRDVPLPETLALLGVGIATLAAGRRRKA